MLYERTLKILKVDETIDEKVDQELNKIYVHYLDKREEITKTTQFKVEEIFGEVFGEFDITQNQLNKLTNF